MADRSGMKRAFIVAVAGLLLFALPGLAGVQPVEIGVNDQWDPQLARDAQLGWVRLNIWWKDVEPSQGTWNWSGVDAAVNGAYNKGLNVLAIIGCPPLWAGGGSNCTTPPLALNGWATFVDAVANRYKNGKVDAYEIWNEPDFKNHAVNIGWNRSHNEPPYYADFVHAAAQKIRQRAPGTKVVVPVFSSRADNQSKVDRRKQLLQKLETLQYGDGQASSFVDVISAHANGLDDRGPIHTATDLRTNNLSYVTNHNPKNANKPVWVTEYGWKSGQVGDTGQKINICSATKAFTGGYRASETGLNQYNIRRAFIYTIKGDGTWGIYNDNNTPRPVVPLYLQKFSFPAIQQPVGFWEFPKCMEGAPPPECEYLRVGSWAEIGSSGLLDPTDALPAGFALVYAGGLAPCCPPDPCLVGPGGTGFVAEYMNAAGDMIVFSASATGNPTAGGVGDLGPHGARWFRDDLSLSVSVSLAEGVPSPESQDLVHRLAAAFDERFGEACVVSWKMSSGDKDVSLPVETPLAPVGYRISTEEGLAEAYEGSCAAGRGQAPQFDVMWSFEGAGGSRVEAGAYRYSGTSGESEVLFGDDRVHWSGLVGVRYWVADTTGEGGRAATQEELMDIARSMDPAFPVDP